MSAWLLDGRLVELILLLMLVESVVLGWYGRRTGRGIALTDLLINLGSGASLLIALHVALRQQPWTWIAAALMASLLFHLADLHRRWRHR